MRRANSVLMGNPKWSTTVAIILATPGMEARYVLPDLGEQYPGSDAYVSMTGTAGSAHSGGGDGWNSQDDSVEGMWFGSTYLPVAEGCVIGFVHVASIVSAGHLRDVITALDDSMYREDPGTATRWPQSACDATGNSMRYVMWPDRVITKTIREQSYAHRDAPGFTPIGSQ